MRKLLILIVLVAALGQGCETDFEVNAPWRDVTIVYGLLDQSESRHFIRINKAFLGEVDVNTMAQIQDSSEYDTTEIVVTLEERDDGGVVTDNITLKPFIDSNKAAGTFYSPAQTLYYFDNALDSSKLYKLVISNKVSGKVVSATTPIIGHFSFQNNNFWAVSKKVGFYKDGSYQTFDKAAWYTPKNGRRYQLTLRFHYREVDLGNPGSDTLNLYIDWIFAATSSSNLNGGEEMGVEINGEDFYQFVANNLTPSSPSNFVERYIGELDFIVDVAGEDLHTYIEVNAPSTGIVQERPEYSNVFDGNGNSEIGIFSCRHTVTKANATLSTSGVTSNSKTELCSGQYTWELGFVNPGTCN